MSDNRIWRREWIDRGVDSNVGARLFQITSAALVSHDIYQEQRYCSANGRRIAVMRSTFGQDVEQLWVFDFDSRWGTMVSPAASGYPCSTPFSDLLYFIEIRDDGSPRLMRLDFATLDVDEVFDLSSAPKARYPIGTMTPDARYYVGNHDVGGNVWGLYRVDLESGECKVIHEHEEISNPHPLIDPGGGRDLLVQHNRGYVMDDTGRLTVASDEHGPTLYLIDIDGENLRRLPIGKPHTGPITGHECWVGTTGRIIFTAAGCIWLYAPGDAKCDLLWRGRVFGHIAASDDGKYFITDDFLNSRIYVGSIHTGRMMPMCDTGASIGVPQATHIHPYMTSDNRHIIFNSDRHGLPQVWACEIPDGFLSHLDDPAPGH